jgi:hypothetical protein
VLHERRTTPFRMLPLITCPGPPPANLAPVALPRGGNPPRPLRAPAGGVSAPAAQSSRRRTDPPASASRQTPRRTRCTAPWPCARPAHPRSASSQPSIERNRDTEISNHGPGARRRSANRRSGVILGAESASGAARLTPRCSHGTLSQRQLDYGLTAKLSLSNGLKQRWQRPGRTLAA